MKRETQNEKCKEESKMAAITKPSVFEMSVNKTNKQQLDEVKLTKSFLDDCKKIAKKLRKEQSNK